MFRLPLRGIFLLLSAACFSAAPAAAVVDVEQVTLTVTIATSTLGQDQIEAELRVKPNLPVLGPRLGKKLGSVREALGRGEFEELGGGRFHVLGHELGPEEVLVERTGREGWSVASESGVTVALETALDAELEREGRMLDLVRLLNSMRKNAGLELTDRIRVRLPESARELLAYEDQIKAEVLAVEIRVDGVEAPVIEKA